VPVRRGGIELEHQMCRDWIQGTRLRLDPNQSWPRRIAAHGVDPDRDSVRLDMSSLDLAVSPPIRRDETLQVALLIVLLRCDVQRNEQRI
jgi:hypothetical protein